jgi:hypothetical protein
MAHRRSAHFARDDKKERVVERRGPLPRARAVVGAVATSISSPFCAKSSRISECLPNLDRLKQGRWNPMDSG